MHDHLNEVRSKLEKAQRAICPAKCHAKCIIVVYIKINGYLQLHRPQIACLKTSTMDSSPKRAKALWKKVHRKMVLRRSMRKEKFRELMHVIIQAK